MTPFTRQHLLFYLLRCWGILISSPLSTSLRPVSLKYNGMKTREVASHEELLLKIHISASVSTDFSSRMFGVVMVHQ
jgi:hypothetical protein